MVFQIHYSLVLIILFSLIGSSVLVSNSSAQEETQIPNWIKNVAGWWASNEISEKEFLTGLTYLVNNNIIFIPFMPCGLAAATADSDPTLEAKLFLIGLKITQNGGQQTKLGTLISLMELNIWF